MIDWKIIFPIFLIILFLFNRTYFGYITIGIIIILDYFKINTIYKKNDYNRANTLIKSYIKTFCKVSGINLYMENEHLLNNDRKEKIIIVSNHMSNLDVMNILLHANLKYFFVAKKELRKLPIIWKLLETLNTLFLDRDNMRESVKTFMKAAKYLTNDSSFVIYPQGTRRNDYEGFKPGAYMPISKSGGKVIIIDNIDLSDCLENRRPFRLNTTGKSVVKSIIHIDKNSSTQSINEQIMNELS